MAPARFQGMCGSCVSYAVTNSLGHRLCARGQLSRPLSVPNLLGCLPTAAATGYTPMAMCTQPIGPLETTPPLIEVTEHTDETH